MVSGFLGKELLRKELRVRISCSPLNQKSPLVELNQRALFFLIGPAFVFDDPQLTAEL